MTTPDGEIDPVVVNEALGARDAVRGGDTAAVNEHLGNIADWTDGTAAGAP